MKRTFLCRIRLAFLILGMAM